MKKSDIMIAITNEALTQIGSLGLTLERVSLWVLNKGADLDNVTQDTLIRRIDDHVYRVSFNRVDVARTLFSISEVVEMNKNFAELLDDVD